MIRNLARQGQTKNARRAARTGSQGTAAPPGGVEGEGSLHQGKGRRVVLAFEPPRPIKPGELLKFPGDISPRPARAVPLDGSDQHLQWRGGLVRSPDLLSNADRELGDPWRVLDISRRQLLEQDRSHRDP